GFICSGSAAVIAFSGLLAIDIDSRHQLAFGAALAGNGNGHSGGNGGGNGNGLSNGNGSGNGNGGAAVDHGPKSDSDIIIVNPSATASALGALNASHASATALAHASPNSEVGKIAAYKQALTTVLSNNQVDLTAYETALQSDPDCTQSACLAARAQVTADLATVDADLKAAANKPITTAVVTAVDTNLGL